MKGAVSFFAGMIFGAVLGAAAALLYAPQSGEELRAKLQEQAVAERQKLQAQYEQQMSKMQAQLDKVRSEVQEMVEQQQGSAKSDSAAK